MKVIVCEPDDHVEFDNGLVLLSDHDQDCCESNYLDFEQLYVGREFDDMTAGEFVDAITMKEDGFSLKDSQKTPAWVQARSIQNGFYSSGVKLVVSDGNKTLTPTRAGQLDYEETFIGEEYE